MLDLRPLRSPGFLHLAVACWVNEFGNWIGEIALAILVFNRTGSPLATAALFLSLRFLPALLAPMLATQVEVLPTRAVLTALYLLEGGLFIALAATSRHSPLPFVLALCACDGLFAITSTALARSALVTGLTGEGLLRAGNALVNLGTMIAIAGAPAIAGVLVASNGAAAALRVDAATFLLTALIVATARKIRVTTDRDVSFALRLQGGLHVLRARPSVRRLMIAVAVTISLGSVALPIEVVFAKHTLHAGDSGYGLLLTSWGIGMVAGGLVFAAATRLRLITTLGVSVVLIALGYGGLALSPTLAVACAFSFVGGTGNSAAWVAAKTALQERIPLSNQSAVMAVLEGVNQVMPAIGFITGGAVTALTSPRVAYAISAVGVAAVVVFFTFWPLDRIRLGSGDRSGTHEGGITLAATPDTQESGTSQRTTSATLSIS